jgi:hypothetical protein
VADARTILVEGQLADHPKDVTPLRQQIGLNLPSRWDAMALRPKCFPGVGSPINLELARETAVLYLSENMDHMVSYDWGLLVGCSLLFPDSVLEYCMEGCLFLYVEESRSSG